MGLDNFLGAMVLGSVQCRGVLLLLHIVGQGPAVLAAGAGRVGYFFFFFFHISSLSYVPVFGRRLDMTEILWFRLLTVEDVLTYMWTASNEFGTYRLCEQRRFRRACASAQSRQNLRCSLIQAVSQEEPSDRKPDPWSL